MDFSTIDVGVSQKAPKETTLSIGLKANGSDAMNGAGEPLALTIFSPASPSGQRELSKWRIKFGLDGTKEDHYAASEDELEKLAEREDEVAFDLAGRLVKGWNLKAKGGKPVPCTPENVRGFFKHFDRLALAFLVAAQNEAISQGNSKAA